MCAVCGCTCVCESMGMNWLGVRGCMCMCVHDVCMDEWRMDVYGCVGGGEVGEVRIMGFEHARL